MPLLITAVEPDLDLWLSKLIVCWILLCFSLQYLLWFRCMQGFWCIYHENVENLVQFMDNMEKKTNFYSGAWGWSAVMQARPVLLAPNVMKLITCMKEQICPVKHSLDFAHDINARQWDTSREYWWASGPIGSWWKVCEGEGTVWRCCHLWFELWNFYVCKSVLIFAEIVLRVLVSKFGRLDCFLFFSFALPKL